MENQVSRWLAEDYDTARDWIETQPAGPLRDTLMGRAAERLSRTDPAAAARLVVDKISSGRAQDEAVITVLHRWALTDRPAAAAWVADFPEGPLRDRALDELEGVGPGSTNTE